MTSVAWDFCKQTTEPVSTSEMLMQLLARLLMMMMMIHQCNAKSRKMWKTLFSSRNGWTTSQYNIGRTWPTPHRLLQWCSGHLQSNEHIIYGALNRLCVFSQYQLLWIFHWKMYWRYTKSSRNIWMNTFMPFPAHSSDKISPNSCWRHCVV